MENLKKKDSKQMMFPLAKFCSRQQPLLELLVHSTFSNIAWNLPLPQHKLPSTDGNAIFAKFHILSPTIHTVLLRVQFKIVQDQGKLFCPHSSNLGGCTAALEIQFCCQCISEINSLARGSFLKKGFWALVFKFWPRIVQLHEDHFGIVLIRLPRSL